MNSFNPLKFNQEIKAYIEKLCVLFDNKNVETTPTVGSEPRFLHFHELATRNLFLFNFEVTVRLSYHTFSSS